LPDRSTERFHPSRKRTLDDQLDEERWTFVQGSVHGHEVLLLLEADRAFTRDSLQAEIAERFGEDARFHTCSSPDMRAGELIEFFETRSKFRSVEGGWRVDRDEICGDAG